MALLCGPWGQRGTGAVAVGQQWSQQGDRNNTSTPSGWFKPCHLCSGLDSGHYWSGSFPRVTSES